MKATTIKLIKALLLKGQEDGDLIFESSGEVLRMNLKPEDIRLWLEKYETYSKRFNLLLACESNEQAIEETSLTWVVGSAIRPIKAKTLDDALKILKSVGVNSALLELAKLQCPDLGGATPWAFYLNRYGLLSTSPIIDIEV